MITPQTTVQLASPVTLNLRAPGRIAAAPAAIIERIFSSFPLVIVADCHRREIRATLSPIGASFLIYNPADFAAACGDSMDDHEARIIDLLGEDPEAVLQALIDGQNPLDPLPPRVPREIQNWRARAILATMGKLADVEAVLAALDEPQRTVVGIAWASGANLARRGPTVLSLAPQLGMTTSDVDQLFIAAAALQV